jgi:hypothetical protein
MQASVLTQQKKETLHIIHHLTQRQPIRQLRRTAIPLAPWVLV